MENGKSGVENEQAMKISAEGKASYFKIGYC